jgi:alkylhydroperoxidase family enzyme
LPGEADKAALRDAGYSELEILELIAQIGLFIFHNRLATVPALPSARIEALPEQWYAKLFRPLMGWYLGRLFVQGGGLKLEEHERTGPFSSVVLAFDGLPFARGLRDAIDVTLEDGALRSRTKLMLFAVVARALGCTLTESDAVRLLTTEHHLEEEVVQSVLDHLAAPELDPLESRIVPFARDTVWYNQATPIQHRARELRDEMKLESFLEMVSAISVANMVCRLGVALPSGARE